MCDNTTYSGSGSYYYLDSDDNDGWTVMEDYHFVLCEKPRRPRFSYLMWLLYSYKNFKLIQQRRYEQGLKKGIKLPRWTLRSKNSFV
jgi:hypothetical protein